ncbi:hypothetical protein Ahy_A04g020784 isoform S [Arachis hypogaea]|uniref:Uncharacterized protein n=1 Tax=Arachis hypogaea TaxID=3818 RepID=A0A445DIK6_ARAHY|nr:hypothetical protein Ahy_A04g020784 isoform S [Arachis hypogaea]
MSKTVAKALLKIFGTVFRSMATNLNGNPEFERIKFIFRMYTLSSIFLPVTTIAPITFRTLQNDHIWDELIDDDNISCLLLFGITGSIYLKSPPRTQSLPLKDASSAASLVAVMNSLSSHSSPDPLAITRLR